MSVTTAELAYCMTLPPKRAISYLKSKGYSFTWDWEEMWQDAHARAFTVAKVTRLDILEDIRGALQQAVDEGKTGRWFRQELEPELVCYHKQLKTKLRMQQPIEIFSSFYLLPFTYNKIIFKLALYD